MIVYSDLEVISGLYERIFVHFAVLSELNKLFWLAGVQCYPAFVPILVFDACKVQREVYLVLLVPICQIFKILYKDTSHVSPAEIATHVGIVGERVGRLELNDFYRQFILYKPSGKLWAPVLSLSVKILDFKNQ